MVVAASTVWCLMCATLLHLSSVVARRHKQSELDIPIPMVRVEGIVDRKAGLPCDISATSAEDSPHMVLWFRESDGIPIYSYDLRGHPEGKPKTWSADNVFGKGAFFRSSSSPAQLVIEKVLLAHEDVYRCRVDFLNSPTRNSKVNFTVVVPPEKIAIYDESTDEEARPREARGEGTSPVFRCQVSGGRPPPRVTWLLDSGLLDETSDTIGDRTINVVHVPPLTRLNVNSRLSCQASNTHHIAPVTKTIQLDVYLRPISVTIQKKDRTLREGVLEEIVCVVNGSRPAANVTWWKQTTLMESHMSTMSKVGDGVMASTLRFVPTSKDDNMNLICRAVNPKLPSPSGALEDSVKLNVLYSPVVTLKMGTGLDPNNIKEGDDVYFECLVQANPKIHKLTWFHKGNEVKHNASAGIVVSSGSLVLQQVTQSTAGHFTCLAVNTEGAAKSNSIHLRILHSPICRQSHDELVGALKQEKVGLTCNVEADPPAVVFRWTFNHSGHSRELPAEYYHNVGTTSTLNYTPVSDLDYGTLTCLASNSVGVQTRPCVFQVVAAGRPFPLFNCTMANRTADSVTVECIENFDGGLPQSYLAEFVQLPVVAGPGSGSNSVWYRNVTSSKPLFHFSDFSPAASYRLNLYSYNAKGRSEPTVLEILAYNAQSRESGLDRITIFSSAVTILAVALLVLIIILVALCRTQLRNKSRDKLKYSSSLSDSSNNITENHRPKSKVIVDDKDPDLIPQKIEKNILPSFVSVCTTSPKHCKRKKPEGAEKMRHLNGTITRPPHGEGHSSAITAAPQFLTITKSTELQESFL
ncbi:unnamed protein product [Bemisia tabaci]|uniref:Ig-like domain-containing protein n=1 Tax=Bemisia tabaci TaxID=7038 RepID=A0A9P0G2S5_BEMTA|nr:unnamed protein product [Bemisia tabaci]